MSRINRERHREYLEALDRLPDLSSVAGAIGDLLLKIYDGGSMPSSVPGVYLGHPVSPTWDDTVSSEPSLDIDTGKSFAVLVLNKVPTVGDLVVAHDLGDRLAAELKFPTDDTHLHCGSLDRIPRSNLTVTVAPQGTGVDPYSFEMIYSSTGPVWSTGCVDHFFETTGHTGHFILSLSCLAGNIAFSWFSYSAAGCETVGGSDSTTNLGGALVVTDRSNDPFHLRIEPPGGDPFRTIYYIDE